MKNLRQECWESHLHGNQTSRVIYTIFVHIYVYFVSIRIISMFNIIKLIGAKRRVCTCMCVFVCVCVCVWEGCAKAYDLDNFEITYIHSGICHLIIRIVCEVVDLKCIAYLVYKEFHYHKL